MRLSARRHGCRYAFTEMVDAGSLVFGNHKTMNLIKRDPSEDFLGIQLVGSEPEILKKAAEIINGLDFSVLDFNLGCPAPKVAKKGEGATFVVRRPDQAIEAFSILAEHSKIPVTAKMRILDENDPAPTVEFAKRLENAGAKTVTIHGRLMKMFYSGPVFHEIIKEVRKNLSIPVVANGGALSAALYRTLVTESGCENGMVARGASAIRGFSVKSQTRMRDRRHSKNLQRKCSYISIPSLISTERKRHSGSAARPFWNICGAAVSQANSAHPSPS